MEEEELLPLKPEVDRCLLFKEDHLDYLNLVSVINLIGFALRHRLSGRLSSHAEK